MTEEKETGLTGTQLAIFTRVVNRLALKQILSFSGKENLDVV